MAAEANSKHCLLQLLDIVKQIDTRQ